MNQFLYFVCHEDNIDLLKEEIKLFHPYLNLSFSKGGFLTFKNIGKELSEQEIKSLRLCFAHDWGINNSLEKEYIIQKLDARESKIDLPSNSPSRAYLKIAEACDFFGIEPNKDINWIECGSSPGGASLYLLNNFNKVIGVDPAEMDQSVLSDKAFIHLQNPIQQLLAKDFPKIRIDHITSDLNLNPKQAIKEVLRISSFHKNNLKSVFMTIKMVKISHVREIPNFIKSFKDAGFHQIYCKQLPSHKREFLIFASIS